MRLVVPVSRSDMHLLPEFVELHQHLKTAGLNHSLHFVVPSPLQSEAYDAKVALDGLFEDIIVHVMDSEPYGGWPYAPNMHFWACATVMRNHNSALPWQLVELDCRPIRANAYDVIAAKYASCGSPFFGFVAKTPWRVSEEFDDRGVKVKNYGAITKSRHGDGDVMMSGCAVYPGNMVDRPSLNGLMADFMKGNDSIEAPWDLHLRFAMQGEGMAHTELIGNLWNTENYRIEAGRLKCDSRQTHEIFEQHPDWEKRMCGGYVHPDAVMVHGCKDDSIFKLVTSGGIPDMFSIVSVVPVPAQAPTMDYQLPPIPSASDPRIDKLEGMVAALLEKIGVLQQVPAPQPPQSPPPPTLTLIDHVRSFVPEKKSVRISDIVKATGSDVATLKALVESSGDLIYKDPGWVARKAA